MKLMRNLALVAVAVALGMGTVSVRAGAAGTSMREPASKKKEKKKKKGAKKAKGKKAAAHHSGAHHSAHKAKAAPSHYPTQPGGSGFADIPNDKKDDLPPPQGEPGK